MPPKIVGKASSESTGSQVASLTVEVARMVCGNVPDSAITIPGLPDCPDEPELAPNINESKVKITNMREHVDLSHLTEAQQNSVIEILEKYESCLSICKTDVRTIRNHAVSFSVTDPSPFFLKCFPMNSQLTQLLMEHFHGMEMRGFITKDLSSKTRTLFYSNSFLVPKNSQTKMLGLNQYRVVTNFVLCNQRIQDSDRGYALPNPEILFSRFSNFYKVSLWDARNYFPSHRVTRATSKFLGLSVPEGYNSYTGCCALLGIRIWPSMCHLTLNCTYTQPTRKRTSIWHAHT